jgi:hypothetical protein
VSEPLLLFCPLRCDRTPNASFAGVIGRVRYIAIIGAEVRAEIRAAQYWPIQQSYYLPFVCNLVCRDPSRVPYQPAREKAPERTWNVAEMSREWIPVGWRGTSTVRRE